LFGRLTGDEYYYNQVSPFCQHFLKVFLLFYAFLVLSKYSSFHRHLFPISYKVFPVFVSRTPLFHPEFLFPKEKHKISFVIFSKKSSDIFFFSRKRLTFIRLRNGQSRSLQHIFSMWLMIQCPIVLSSADGFQSFILGNTAQFPPDGLSTAPAAAARHLRCQNAR